MRINVIAIGKLKKEYQTIFEDFKKRISFFSSFNLIELKEINHPNIEVKKQKETKNILETIPKGSKVFLMSLKGKEFSSEEFSYLFNESNLTFVIGGSNGVDESLFKNKICFSRMTFNHQMFRIFLVEQIYRGLSIKNNGKYHK